MEGRWLCLKTPSAIPVPLPPGGCLKTANPFVLVLVLSEAVIAVVSESAAIALNRSDYEHEHER